MDESVPKEVVIDHYPGVKVIINTDYLARGHYDMGNMVVVLADIPDPRYSMNTCVTTRSWKTGSIEIPRNKVNGEYVMTPGEVLLNKVLKMKQHKEAVKEIKWLFDRYVTPDHPNKKFMDSAVVNKSEYFAKADSNVYQYEYYHSGVEIKYKGRITYCKDDLDYFVDSYVSVDKKVIVNKTRE